ncbi:putative Ubiquitin like modifier activating enzyme ATG7 N terminus ThiF family [Trypanosoma vivax]|nr:putative Ubiquitin like modifier activating enzyme ATG7 N terminus ThiF family [Trypanosoma vivax]
MSQLCGTPLVDEKLKYKEFFPHIEVHFWHELERCKLHKWGLQEPIVPLTLFSTVVTSASFASAATLSIRPDSLGNDVATVTSNWKRNTISGVSYDATQNDVGAKSSSGVSLTDAAAAEGGGVSCFPVLLKGQVQNFNTVEQLYRLSRREVLWSALQDLLLRSLFPPCTRGSPNESPCSAQTSEDCTMEATWEEANFAIAALFTYADLKNHRFHYTMAFPALDLGPPVYVRRRIKGGYNAVGCVDGTLYFPSRRAVDGAHEYLLNRLRDHPGRGPNPFILVNCVASSDSVGEGAEKDAVECLSFTPRNIRYALKRSAFVIVMADLSASGRFPTWCARNVVGALRLLQPCIRSFCLYCVRCCDVEESVFFDCFCDPLPYGFEELRKAVTSSVQTGEGKVEAEVVPAPDAVVGSLRAVGWVERRTEDKGAQQRVRCIDLGVMMLPELLAESSARLNLDLMKWRMLRELRLDGLAHCRALLLGSGTLGCNVARHLLMWGVRNITLVDRGNVSFSNPVRQTLFELSDVTNPQVEERNKAVAAAKALKRILPTVNARGVRLNIRMPGHRIDKEHESEAASDVEKLDQLIREHDVVFLLTDSREARWLPTVVTMAHNKPALSVALAFDSYVVMRHGVDVPECDKNSAVEPKGERLGCYFCSDVVAPCDSMTARTLDQQCTVTRPGLSAIASAIAVELLAQLYNHPLGFCCPPYISNPRTQTEKGPETPLATCDDTFSGASEAVCPLGNIPNKYVAASHAITTTCFTGTATTTVQLAPKTLYPPTGPRGRLLCCGVLTIRYISRK